MKAKRLFKTRQPSNLGYARLRKQLSNFQLSDLQHLQTAFLSTWERPSTEDSTFIDSIGLPTVSVAFLSESVPQSTRLLVDDSPEIYWMPSEEVSIFTSVSTAMAHSTDNLLPRITTFLST